MPWLLLIPAGILVWFLSERSTEARLRASGRPELPSPSFTRMPWDHRPRMAPVRRNPLPRGPRATTAADYLRHLNEACWASRVLDSVKSEALAADIAALMESPPEVAQALQILCQPIEASFLQKDLNVLGSSPPLPEDGSPSRGTTEAVKAFQGKFGLPQTGEVDAATVAAVRYSVGCIYSQDRMAHGGA